MGSSAHDLSTGVPHGVTSGFSAHSRSSHGPGSPVRGSERVLRELGAGERRQAAADGAVCPVRDPAPERELRALDRARCRRALDGDRELGRHAHGQLVERRREVVRQERVEPYPRRHARRERHHRGDSRTARRLPPPYPHARRVVDDGAHAMAEPHVRQRGGDRIRERLVAARHTLVRRSGSREHVRARPDDPERHLPEVDGVRALQPHPHRVTPGTRRIQRVEERAERQAGRSVRRDRGQRRIGRREERVLLFLTRGAGPARPPGGGSRPRPPPGGCRNDRPTIAARRPPA